MKLVSLDASGDSLFVLAYNVMDDSSSASDYNDVGDSQSAPAYNDAANYHVRATKMVYNEATNSYIRATKATYNIAANSRVRMIKGGLQCRGRFSSPCQNAGQLSHSRCRPHGPDYVNTPVPSSSIRASQQRMQDATLTARIT